MAGKRAAAFIAMVAMLVSFAFDGTAHASGYRQRQRDLQQLIDQKRAQLHQAEALEQSILGAIQASDARRAALQRQIAGLSTRLLDARTKIGVLQARLDSLGAGIELKQVQIDQAEGQVADLQQRLQDRAAQLYMSVPGSVPGTGGILNDVNDFVSATAYESGLISGDQILIESVQRAQQSLEVQQTALAATEQTVQAARDDIATQAARILDMRSQLSSAQAAVAQEIATRRVLLAQVQSQKAAYLRAIRNLVAESNSITALLRGIQRGQHVYAGSGGWLKWPVSGPITSPFGWRIHPVYHYRSFHTGIDIGAPMGTTVHAARAGTVVYVGYQGAYGNIVIVDHGSGIATVYAHLSRFYVRTGQYVRTMSAIAAVGSTGWSTGPHLHFEVRQGGTPVNPVRWL
ncbi:MAG: murein hydrolase activator EnvC [Actinomycetota bacterium]